MDESIKNLDNSILTSQKSGKNLKLSQISKFLSPNASTINKLNELSSQPKSSKKQSKFTKKSFKLNFLKLNDSKSLDESIICGDEIDKNSKFLQNKNKSSDNQKESLELESTKSCSPFNCPICSIDLTYDDNRQSHVNQCLDKGFSKNAKKKKHQPKSDDIQSKNILEVDKLKCDSLEKEKKFTQLMIEDAVPNCPICGKVFHTINSRQTHLKKCAQVFHIKTESLFELVKKQQDNLERDLARGLIPTDVYFIKRKNPDTEKKKIKKLTSSELTGENSNGIKIKKETKAQKKKQQAFKESKLILNSNFDRKEILATRFSEILCKNTIKYGQRKPSDIVTPLVKTKFKPTDNYLWNRCKYFIESEECFYVKVFLDSGKFLIGHQIFVEKQNKEKYDNVEIVNTQTAFLLAELNDQSNAENMSIYYSQTQQQLEYSALNLTTNRTMHDISDKFAIKQNDSISQIRSQYSIEPTYFQPTYRDTQNAYNLVNSNSQILRSTDQYKNEKNVNLDFYASFSDTRIIEKNSSIKQNASNKSVSHNENLDSSDSIENCQNEDFDKQKLCQNFPIENEPNENKDYIKFFPIKNDFKEECSNKFEVSIEECIITDEIVNNSKEESAECHSNSDRKLIGGLSEPDELLNEIKKKNFSLEKSENYNLKIPFDQTHQNSSIKENRLKRFSSLINKFNEEGSANLDDSCQIFINDEIEINNVSLHELDRNQNNFEISKHKIKNVDLNFNSNESYIELPTMSLDKNETEKPGTHILNTDSEDSSTKILADEDNSETESIKFRTQSIVEFKNKNFRLMDIVEDDEVAASTSRKSICLIDETILSSSDNGSNSENIEINDENAEIDLDKLNILDQNVLLDDTCLDVSNTSLNLSDNDPLNITQRFNNNDNHLLNKIQKLNEINNSGISHQISIHLTPKHNILKGERSFIEINDNSNSKHSTKHSVSQIKSLINKKEDSNDSVPKINFNFKNYPTSNKRRKSIEVNQSMNNSINSDYVMLHSPEDKKFKKDISEVIDYNNDKISIMCTKTSSANIECATISLDTGSRNYNKIINDDNFDNGIMDNIWDNFGDQDQFDDFYNYNDNFSTSYVEANTIANFDINKYSHQQDTTLKCNNSSLISCEKMNNQGDVWSNFESEQQFENQEEHTSMNNEEKDLEPNRNTPIFVKKKPFIKQLKWKEPESDSGPLTPIADYVGMSSPNLKEELKKYGLKPLSKKQAVKKLVEIYQFTHKRKLKRSTSYMDLKSIVENESKRNGKKSSIKKSGSVANLQTSKPPKMPNRAKTTKTVAFGFTVVDQINSLADGDDSEDDSSSTQSLFVSTQKKKKKISKNLDENEAKEYLYNFIRDNEDIYLQVLNYIPLDIEIIIVRLKENLAPRRCNSKLLMKILDEFCVTFTMKNSSTKTHQGKPKYQKKT